MRVLHVGAGNLFGGIESMLVTLARHRHVEPSLEQDFAMSFEGRVAAELRAEGASVTIIGAARLSRPWGVWRARQRLRSLVVQRGYDAVLFHGPWGLVAFGAAVRRARVPVALWLHAPPAEDGLLDRAAARRPPALLIANSQYTAAAARSAFPGIEPRVILCPVGAATAPERTRAEVRCELGTLPDTTVIIHIGRMEVWKGQRQLLAALDRLRDLPDWVCWVVGGAQRESERAYANALRAQAAACGIADRVRFCGDRRDVYTLLAAADIYCQPNEAPEPFGITYVEAMQAGLPVVATRLGGAMEIVDAKTGMLIPAGDVHATADALRHLVTNADTRTRLGEAGRVRATLLSDPAARISDLAAVVSRVAVTHGPDMTRRTTASATGS